MRTKALVRRWDLTTGAPEDRQPQPLPVRAVTSREASDDVGEFQRSTTVGNSPAWRASSPRRPPMTCTVRRRSGATRRRRLPTAGTAGGEEGSLGRRRSRRDWTAKWCCRIRQRRPHQQPMYRAARWSDDDDRRRL